VAQELINKVKSKCCGIKVILILIMKSISILRLTAILLCSMHLLGSASLQAQMNKWVNYSPDLTTVLKNPAMGWMMYEEG
ncbi:hypothetical protein AAAU21_09065, partial [Phocaeicola vulgatus]